MKKISIFTAVFLIFISFNIYAKKKSDNAAIPTWVIDSESEFPHSTYISFLATGKDIDSARDAALAGVASFFKAQVSKTSLSLYEGVQSDKGGDVSVDTIQSLQSRTLVQVDAVLKAVETTTPYYAKKEKNYYCLAYFEKKKAFAIYDGDVNTIRVKFKKSFEAAQNENDLFNKIRLYNTAKTYTGDLLEKIVIAQCLAQSDSLKKYEKDIVDCSDVDYKLQEALNSPINISVTGDEKTKIYSAVAKILQGIGFSVSKKAQYNAKVDVTYSVSESKEDDITLYSCNDAQVTIDFFSSDEEFIHNYSTSTTKKVSSYRSDKIATQVIDALIKALQSNLGDTINQWLTTGD